MKNYENKKMWDVLDFFSNFNEETTVVEWMEKKRLIEPRHLEKYPNAKKAMEVMDSKLYKVMK